MTQKNFRVKNGLSVGNVSIDANTDSIANVVNLTANGNIDFSQAQAVTLPQSNAIHIGDGFPGQVLQSAGNGNVGWLGFTYDVGMTSVVDYFTGNGNADTYTLTTTPVNQAFTTVVIDGITQLKETYSISNNQITFGDNLPQGARAEVTTINGSNAVTATYNTLQNGNSSIVVNANGNIDISTTAMLNLGSIDNVYITGGNIGQVLATDGEGALRWISMAYDDANYSNFAGEANTANSAEQANTANTANVAYSVDASNITGTISFATNSTNANVAFSVDAANVDGTVANANYSAYAGQANTSNSATIANTANIAYSVSGSNVSGQVASAALATYASTANAVAGSNVSGTVANATYATTAGTAYSVSGSNVTDEVANATYSTYAGTAYSVSGANIAGAVANATYAVTAGTANSVALANVSGAGNLAALNKNGNANHILYGNGVFAALPTMYANSNVATYLASFGSNTISTTGNVSVGKLTTTGAVVTGVVSKTGLALANVGSIGLSKVLTLSPLYNSLWTDPVSSIPVTLTFGNVSVDFTYSVDEGGHMTFNVTSNNYGSVNVGDTSTTPLTGTNGLQDLNETLTVASVQTIAPTAIDLTKTINRLSDGVYSLADGTEGQIVYLTTQSTVTSASTIYVTVDNFRTTGTSSTNYNLYPFVNGGTCRLLFTNGSWQSEIVTSITGSSGSANTANSATIANTANTLTTARTINGVTFDGSANITLANIVNGTSNVRVATANGNIVMGVAGTARITVTNAGANINGTANISGNLTAANASLGNLVTANFFSGSGANLTSLPGANVTGTVTNATYAVTAGTANSVAGANVTGTVANATYATTAGTANAVAAANITGTINYATYAGTANSVAGANVSGTVSAATTAGTVTTNAQPNITSVGTLTSLTTSGDITVGGNLVVNGNVTTVHSAEINLQDKNIVIASEASTAAEANGAGITANGANAQITYISGTDTWNFNKQIVGNVTGTASNANVADTANSATTAGTVTASAQSNITSLGTLENLTIDSAGGNVLTITGVSTPAYGGSQTWKFWTNPDIGGPGSRIQFPDDSYQYTAWTGQVDGANVTSEVANATYATTAGSADSVAGANVSGAVENANVANTANVAYSVAAANITGTISFASNATVANTANAVAGANVSGWVANANIANVAYSVAAANITGTVSFASNATVANTANAVAGANVTGTVANATYATSAGSATSATTAGTVTTAAQSNITSLGTLTAANISGELRLGNMSANRFRMVEDTGTLYVQGGNGTVSSSALIAFTPWLNTSGNAAMIVDIANKRLAIGKSSASVELDVSGQASFTGNVFVPGTGNVAHYIQVTTNAAAQGIGMAADSGNYSYVYSTGNMRFYTGATTSASGAPSSLSLAMTVNSTALNVNGNITAGNSVTANYFIGSGANLSAIAGANVTGWVANANIANIAYSVAAANITGTIGYASNANVANTANSVAAANITGTINYATYAGTANAVAGANVTGTVANATYATTAGTANSVALANVSGAGNIASLNIDGNSSTVLYGNGSFAALPTMYGNSNVATLLASFGSNTISTTGNANLGNIALSNSMVSWSTSGVGAPTFTTTSVGTKLLFYPAVNGSNVDYSMGIEAGMLWSAVPKATSSFAHKWYGGTTTLATLTGDGALAVTGQVSANSANAFVAGSAAVDGVALSMPLNSALRNHSASNNIMYFDTNVGGANTGGQFRFRGSNAYTLYATVDANGITLPTRPAFRIYGAGTTNNLSTSQNGNGQLNSNNYSVDYNQGTGFNSSTGIFTAPVAGLYNIAVNGRNSGYSSGISQLAAVKNAGGASQVLVMIEWAASSTMNHAGGATVAQLAANDTVTLRVLAGQINFDSNDNWSVTYIG